MKNYLFILCLSWCARPATFDSDFTPKDLPPAFALDDFDGCSGLYCLVEFEIQPLSSSKFYRYIKNFSSVNLFHFNRKLLRRGICMEKCTKLTNFTAGKPTDMAAMLVACESERLKESYEISVRVKEIEICKRKGEEYSSDFLDFGFGCFVLALFAVIFVATIFDEKENKYLICFSLKENWNFLINGANNEKVKQFNSMYGVKVIIMVSVITAHVLLIITFGYPANPHFIEKIYKSGLELFLNGPIVLQSFFIMSAFLSTYNFITYTEGRMFNLGLLPKAIFNRWCRLVPTLMFMTLSVSTWVSRMSKGGPSWWRLIEVERNGCRIAWYISADMQLSMFGVIVLMVIWRHPHYKVGLVTLLTFGLVTLAFQTWAYSLRPLCMNLNPESVRNLFSGNDAFMLNYVSAQANLAGYVSGMMTAYIYRDIEHKKDTIAHTKIFKLIQSYSLQLCLLCILSGQYFHPSHEYKYDVIEVSLYTILTVFIYHVGFCSFLIWTFTEPQAKMTSFLNHRIMNVLGRLTYCALLVHVSVITTYLAQDNTLHYVTLYKCFLITLTSVVVSYALAIPLHLIVELPFCNLQRKLQT